MGKRQKIRLLCAEGDRRALRPVLDALQARGVGVSPRSSASITTATPLG